MSVKRYRRSESSEILTTDKDKAAERMDSRERMKARGKGPLVIAISGMKKTGKTSLIEALLPILSAENLRVAVIKHDGHSFLPDPEGTDTGRFMASGAEAAAIFDGSKFKIIRNEPADEHRLLKAFEDMDIVLLEGFRHSSWPKIEIVRAGVFEHPVADPATMIALMTDLPISFPGVPVLSIGEADTASRIILDIFYKGRK